MSTSTRLLDKHGKEQILATHNLDESELDRLVSDILSLTTFTYSEWIRARHTALQAEGYDNQRIYEQIQLELPSQRFAASPQSVRQIRRIIYG